MDWNKYIKQIEWCELKKYDTQNVAHQTMRILLLEMCGSNINISFQYERAASELFILK